MSTAESGNNVPLVEQVALPQPHEEVPPLTLLMSIDEVSRLLRISIRTIWRLDASGRFPQPIRLGRTIRWNREELVRWVDAGCPPRREWELIRNDRSGRIRLRSLRKRQAS